MINYVVSGIFHSLNSNDDVTITFKYTVDEEQFLKDITVPVWKKIQDNNDIMNIMKITVHNDYLWCIPEEDWLYNSWSNDKEEANMNDGEYMCFTIISQRVVVGNIEDDDTDFTFTLDSDIYLNTEDNETDINTIGIIRDFFWDSFEPVYSPKNCDGCNYDCHYKGGMKCNVCCDIW